MGLATPLRIIGCLQEPGQFDLVPSAAGFFIGGQVLFSSHLWEAVAPEPDRPNSVVQQGHPDFDLTQLDHQENHTRAPARNLLLRQDSSRVPSGQARNDTQDATSFC